MTELTLSAYIDQESTKTEQTICVRCLSVGCIRESLYGWEQYSGKARGLG